MPPSAPRHRVLVWNEHRHERQVDEVRAIYPQGMHAVLAEAVGRLVPGAVVETATLDEAGHGLGEERLSATDVLVWWGHMAHEELADEAAERVRRHVLSGMGLIALHSSHLAKPFRLLMGTTCHLRWRGSDERELLWTVAPSHAIARGVAQPLELGEHEMYSEFFDIPQPDELVFVSSFSGGEVFRSGCCFGRGAGRIFYFSPGHETYPVYHREDVQRVVANAVEWASAAGRRVPAAQDSEHAPYGWWQAG